MNLKDISVIITSFNEAETIARSFQGLEAFGELILVDSFSTDATLDIARRFPVAIYSRPYESAAKQKNWALRVATREWALILDADEALPPGLTEEIRALDATSYNGYWMRRDSEYLGGPIRHCGWQRDKVLRLLKRGCGEYAEKEVHEEIRLAGAASILHNRLQHSPYRRVEQHLDKIEEYSTRGARDFNEGGGRLALLNMLVHPPFRFLRMYLLQRGFLDGSRGFILCLLSSYGVFLKYAKAWEMRHCRPGR